ncbi:unnamed protein product, partial [Trichogramma brassicae]
MAIYFCYIGIRDRYCHDVRHRERRRKMKIIAKRFSGIALICTACVIATASIVMELYTYMCCRRAFFNETSYMKCLSRVSQREMIMNSIYTSRGARERIDRYEVNVTHSYAQLALVQRSSLSRQLQRARLLTSLHRCTLSIARSKRFHRVERDIIKIARQKSKVSHRSLLIAFLAKSITYAAIVAYGDENFEHKGQGSSCICSIVPKLFYKSHPRRRELRVQQKTSSMCAARIQCIYRLRQCSQRRIGTCTRVCAVRERKILFAAAGALHHGSRVNLQTTFQNCIELNELTRRWRRRRQRYSRTRAGLAKRVKYQLVAQTRTEPRVHAGFLAFPHVHKATNAAERFLTLETPPLMLLQSPPNYAHSWRIESIERTHRAVGLLEQQVLIKFYSDVSYNRGSNIAPSTTVTDLNAGTEDDRNSNSSSNNNNNNGGSEESSDENLAKFGSSDVDADYKSAFDEQSEIKRDGHRSSNSNGNDTTGARRTLHCAIFPTARSHLAFSVAHCSLIQSVFEFCLGEGQFILCKIAKRSRLSLVDFMYPKLLKWTERPPGPVVDRLVHRLVRWSRGLLPDRQLLGVVLPTGRATAHGAVHAARRDHQHAARRRGRGPVAAAAALPPVRAAVLHDPRLPGHLEGQAGRAEPGRERRPEREARHLRDHPAAGAATAAAPAGVARLEAGSPAIDRIYAKFARTRVVDDMLYIT